MAHEHDDKQKTENESTTVIEQARSGGRKFVIFGGLFLAILLAFWLIPARHHADQEAAPAPLPQGTTQTAGMGTCPEFSTEHHTCSFGDKAAWASTGTVAPGEKPKSLCFDRLASKGDYTLLVASGREYAGEKGPSALEGFVAPPGQTRAVTYWLADTLEDCKKT